MLTKSDLKNIDGLLDKKFKKELKPLKVDITKINYRQLMLGGILNFSRGEEYELISPCLRTGFYARNIKKDTDAIISFFDREFLGLQRRTVRIEDHLNLPPLQPFV